LRKKKGGVQLESNSKSSQDQHTKTGALSSKEKEMDRKNCKYGAKEKSGFSNEPQNENMREEIKQ